MTTLLSRFGNFISNVLRRESTPVWMTLLAFVGATVIGVGTTLYISSADRQASAIAAQVQSLEKEASEFNELFGRFADTIIRPEMAETETERVRLRALAVPKIEEVRQQLQGSLLRQREAAELAKAMIADEHIRKVIQRYQAQCLDVIRAVRTVNNFMELKSAWEAVGAWQAAKMDLFDAFHNSKGATTSAITRSGNLPGRSG